MGEIKILCNSITLKPWYYPCYKGEVPKKDIHADMLKIRSNQIQSIETDTLVGYIMKKKKRIFKLIKNIYFQL